MFNAYIRLVTRWAWAVIAAWLALAAVVGLWFPRLPEVVSHHKTTYLPDSSPVITAHDLLNRVDPAHQAQSTLIVAIRNPHGLTAADHRAFIGVLEDVARHRQAYGVNWVEHAENVAQDTAQTFKSRDGTTEIALLGLPSDVTDPHLPQTLAHLRAAFARHPADARIYFTGDVAIEEDDIQLSQAGADRTAVVTVALLLAILLAVFRSFVAPLVTLCAIGLSYFISAGFVAWAAEHGLPVSTFTQTFLVATLFGAGTDYSIIVLNRFREELTRQHSHREALAAAVAGVGKTVVFSAATVFVSFAVLYFARFGLYRSSVGVAIGILVTLLMCLTFLPALAGVFGRALFWPRQPAVGSEHKPSRFWDFTGRIATRYPWRVVLACVLVLAPVALAATGARSFDPMQDIPAAPSVQGFRQVAQAFGAGRAMPVQIALQTSANLRSPQGMATIDQVTRSLAAVSGVAEVDSATQPLGKPVAWFHLARQNQAAADGLTHVQQGLAKLAASLQGGAQAGVKGDEGLAALRRGADQVANGADALRTAAEELAAGSRRLADGAFAAASGADTLTSGLRRFTSALQQENAALQQLQQGVAASAASAHQVAGHLAGMAQAEQQTAAGVARLADALAAWAAAHPDAAGDPAWQQIMALAKQLAAGSQTAAASASALTHGAQSLAAGMDRLSAGAQAAGGGMARLSSTSAQLATGAAQVAGGTAQVASGAEAWASGAAKTALGAGVLAAGSRRVAAGLAQYEASAGPLTSGLSAAGAAARQLGAGVGQVASYLRSTARAQQDGDPGFYVSQDTLDHNPGVRRAMDAYISPDGHIAKFTVVLSENPYSAQAIAKIPNIRQAVESGLAVSPIRHGRVYVGGTTALQAEMNRLSGGDLLRSLSIVFAAIFLLLAAMLRSLLAPFYILVSLAGTYYVTIAVVEQLATRWFGHPAIGWSVPFFAFLLLVALGVDYSIFLMARFDEEMRRGLSPLAAMRESMRRMGGVILSAAVIMAGTFGSLLVTGIASIEEIGLSVVVGLFVYTAVALAWFVPACAAVIGRGHGWPFQVQPAAEPPHPSPPAPTPASELT
ncbi:transporter [Alicyclobacillus cellulosilyticus]|uniref:Transporter n=1 Tax=Alicyclobacillus cellulosilyticus TaxID=1003997 RepID=A0A917K3U3_9BACL|nr:MMPL family transporter [Alicyclobacillus cellulosilyticus]GGI99022.1 transporter [Alicyclobacillus cellulosilyticus]